LTVSQDEFARALNGELEALRADYARTHPASAARFAKSKAVMPGGNTRSVLHFEPFPLYAERGRGARIWDVDGIEYLDFVGEFSAGLFGHSDPVITAAIKRALDDGVVLAAPTDLEVRLAELLVERFPSIERVRFCNSGTEANILALMTARVATGRNAILVFNGAYHGGVLTFPLGGNRLNLPLDFVFAEYNDTEATEQLIEKLGDSLAAVIVEPILGAAGNIPATREFVAGLRGATSKTGALLIFDEVKTSRCGAGGMQAHFDVTPDLTTLGKYIGGGLACGAFGGRADIMMAFDPARRDGLKHAGTFNNNVCAMAAGVVALSEVFTKAKADAFFMESEVFRQHLNAECTREGHNAQFTGMGSIFTVHFTRKPISSPKDIPAQSRSLAQLFHLFCLMNNVLVASRGDVFMSLPTEARDREKFSELLPTFMARYSSLMEQIDA
jgi:glutamate-1-semialdehyde 2,1-aminomutase